MKLGLINSAWFGSPLGTEEGIRKTKEIGFDTIDILADPLEINSKERRLIKETCAECALPIISVVCVALGIADFNKSVREFHVERAGQHLEFAYALHASNLLLVLGEYIWQQEVIQPRDQWQWAVQGVRELGEFAQSLDLTIAIELEPFHLSLVNSASTMDQFLRDVNHPAVQANIDISHLALTHTPAESLKQFEGRIGHVHLSDCDGQKHGDLPPGRGVVDFPSYLEGLRAAGFDGTVSIELEYAPEGVEIENWVREAYRETDRIMRSMNLRS